MASLDVFDCCQPKGSLMTILAADTQPLITTSVNTPKTPYLNAFAYEYWKNDRAINQT